MKFQSAPHFSSEANTTLFLKSLIHVVSIRASLQQRGERASRKGRLENIAVSIRASLQQRGEPNEPTTEVIMLKFQTAPHFSSEANRGHANTSTGQQGFNPRLTSAARRTQLTYGLLHRT